jgi:hypothetical protein
LGYNIFKHLDGTVLKAEKNMMDHLQTIIYNNQDIYYVKIEIHLEYFFPPLNDADLRRS